MQKAWWRNVRYNESPHDKGLALRDAPDISAPASGSLPFGERLEVAELREDGNDLWLRLEAGQWVLARGAGVVNCVEMAHWKQHVGRIPESAIYGQDFPVGMYTEGYAGASDISVVSASGDAFWREVNIEMLCRDIATATLFEKGWEGDEDFQDWVAYYATNVVKYSKGKRFVVIVKPMSRWRMFKDPRSGVPVQDLKDFVGRAQDKELNWIHRVQAKVLCKWDEIEFLTAFAFLRKYCSWGAEDCKRAAYEKLAGLCGEFHTKESAPCEAELKCAYWSWMEAFDQDSDVQGVLDDAAVCFGALQKLALKEQRPALQVNLAGPRPEVWATLASALKGAATEAHSAALQEPLLCSALEQRELARRHAARIAELEAQVQERERQRQLPCPEFVITAGADRAAHMWSVKSGRRLGTFSGHNGQIWSCCLSPDERHLVTTSQDGTAKIWSVEDGRCVSSFSHKERAAPNWACLTPDMKYLCTAVNDCTAKVWDIKSGKLLKELKHGNCVNSVCTSPCGAFLFTASDDNLGRRWRIPSGGLARTYDGKNCLDAERRGLYSCCLTGDGEWFFTAAFDGQTTMFAVAGGEIARTFKAPGSDPAKSVCASPSGDHVFVGRGSVVQMWSTASGELVSSFVGHRHDVTAQWVSQDGLWLCSSSLDGTAKVWNTATGQLQRTYAGHEGFVQGIVGA